MDDFTCNPLSTAVASGSAADSRSRDTAVDGSRLRVGAWSGRVARTSPLRFGTGLCRERHRDGRSPASIARLRSCIVVASSHRNHRPRASICIIWTRDLNRRAGLIVAPWQNNRWHSSRRGCLLNDFLARFRHSPRNAAAASTPRLLGLFVRCIEAEDRDGRGNRRGSSRGRCIRGWAHRQVCQRIDQL